MESPDYNEEDFAKLNDIERVLTKLNIKVRENATTWRSVDDILADIASKWDTFDQTSKNAIATAVAGTRQRENVITLFENWDDVAKYEEIASNAYGTAAEKMNAYTDSVEAAQTRLTVAVEDWALRLNQSNHIKAFYEVLTKIIENLDVFAVSLLGITTLLKPKPFSKKALIH